MPVTGAGPATQCNAVMVVDMGAHVLRHVPGLQPIVQLLAPGLEERARALPPLLSAHSTPGRAPAGPGP